MYHVGGAPSLPTLRYACSDPIRDYYGDMVPLVQLQVLSKWAVSGHSLPWQIYSLRIRSPAHVDLRKQSCSVLKVGILAVLVDSPGTIISESRGNIRRRLLGLASMRCRGVIGCSRVEFEPVRELKKNSRHRDMPSRTGIPKRVPCEVGTVTFIWNVHLMAMGSWFI